MVKLLPPEIFVFQDMEGQAVAQKLKLPMELEQDHPVEVLKHLALVRTLIHTYQYAIFVKSKLHNPQETK